MRRPSRLRGLSRLRRVGSAALAVGGVLYSSWLLGLVLPTGLSQRASFASELEASGRAWAWLFRAGDVISGVLLAIGATLALLGHVDRDTPDAASGTRRITIVRAAMRLGFVGVLVTGITTAAAGPLPVDCASSTPDCTALRAAGVPTSWHDGAHHAISNVSGYAFSVALAAFAVAVLCGGGGWWLRHAIWPILIAAVLTSIPVSNLLWEASWRGLPQRLNEAVETALFVVLAVDVRRPGRARIDTAGTTRPSIKLPG